MAGTHWQRLKTCLQPFALFILLAVPSPVPPAARAQVKTPIQHLVCNIGYTPQQCAADMTELRKVLAKYPVDALGEWTWVLVRSEDWKRILVDRGFDPNNPAFSYLPRRETFFDGSLVVKASSRGVELSGQWHVPIEDLLDLAVRHELAHALCNEPNETKADRTAIALKNGGSFSCQITPTSTSRAHFVIIGGTEPQRRFVSCVAKVSGDELRKLPNSDQPMTFVILEHRKFLQTRDVFHAYRTTLAFSNLAIRRIYLSSRVFADRETALWVIGHELGHFVIRDGIEGHAEFAAERIRWRARQTCPSGLR